jgi:hypothetical protein
MSHRRVWADKTKRPVSKTRREWRLQRILLIVTGALTALAAGLLAYGWLNEKVFPLREPVARVTWRPSPSGGREEDEGVEISTGAFQARVRFERARYIALAKQDAEAANELADARGFGQMVLDRMTREILVREEAAQRGFAVSEEEIDRYIEQAYGTIQPTPTPASLAQPGPALEPTPGPPPESTRTAFEKKYRDDLEMWAQYGINKRAFREIVRAQLLEDKLREVIGREAFQDWLNKQLGRITLLDRWRERVPSDPAWP